ncbi:hypothetical protein ASPZODRAFT_148820 [Penicilliopsis zonata CBS 506.65]|uniref:Uncharacterized protein n=1 Tax=Penicilliopsis zonata CBS 506.65 TaxID=1073090 RepID=A0A1L9SWL4_9EURO|nr:hypothetical protein ASPZODRAFT_148820 [Penicilliopsis zonata CBS 506.65]OJJ51554.1 hypothetical protein ASPZODRAFT_148820 [Penicilliopsis zonata CBS 506.65]
MSLYGQARSKSAKKEASTSTSTSTSTLAFSTHLASLIAGSRDSEGTSTSSSNAASRGRTRPSRTSKPSDLFARPNRGAQKRAAADEAGDDAHHVRQVHQSSAEIGTIDAATFHRSKRRMEEKARLYEDLKSGLYLAESSDEEPDTRDKEDYLARLRRKEREGLVDFDKKWQDKAQDDENEEGEEEDDDNASIVSYEDELGRTRRGTRAEAAQARALQNANNRDTTQRWKPVQPENLIYGATVQSEAFAPSSAMTHLASRRDRSPTPETEMQMHYDAEAEARARGTGFYAFSRDAATRDKEMAELMQAREETQREREARIARRAERLAVREQRRVKVDELRAKRRADVFLAGL